MSSIISLCRSNPHTKNILRCFHKTMYRLTVRRKYFYGCTKSHAVFSECAFFRFIVPAKSRIPSRVADAAMG